MFLDSFFKQSIFIYFILLFFIYFYSPNIIINSSSSQLAWLVVITGIISHFISTKVIR